MEKLALALVSSTKKLPHYLQAHTIVVLINQPLKSLFAKLTYQDAYKKWAVELNKYDIMFEPRKTIKGRIVAEFITKFSPKHTSDERPFSSSNSNVDVGRGPMRG